ncbi:6-carboxytetrahydropterin synthase [Siccirubricoccus sp. KC 17139]|uniref:6-carboxy-5,6,7,8-tetrahydropterin synthase n=1 Tax=Siccirubricoccus soli TaxID=2899147 RepID=A0ABT1D1B2_9PROT|nr:6-carboxytetrahydropterin synthase [Siccirubricoccus soli]MCO6415703.1 6-carboxytetrahydropterin synthase [Siccirubricoccus soli]MCP2681835.1 6-carboxytetrahydropterin synthase [Siccirubricoccus soli]
MPALTFRDFAFDAAHKTTPDTPLHGHSFKVRVVMSGDPDPVYGWSHDLLEVAPVLDSVRKQLDHRYLNDIEGLEMPTLENVARWIWNRLDAALPGLQRVELWRGAEGAAEGTIYSRDDR